MPHVSQPAVIDLITKKRLQKMIDKGKSKERNGIHLIENLGVFIDTHRDQPHVGVFHDDIHRGQCRPTPITYLVEDDALLDLETGQILPRHEKHMFVTNEFYSEFIVRTLMDTGADPRDGSGCMPTSHFRDARTRVYELKSFRELVRIRAQEEGINA